MPTISAVIVNHDGGEQILHCIRCLKDQEEPCGEIIVVDNGSTDASPAAIRSAETSVRVIELGTNLGPSVARNRGVAAAEGSHVLLVDDDVYPKPDCLRLLMRRMRDLEAAAVAPRLVLHPDSELIQLDGADAHFVGAMKLRNPRAPLAGASAEPRPIGAFSTSCVLIDRQVLVDAGGLDESFFIYQEDLEIGLRLRTLGHLLICDPAAVALHDRGAGTPGLSFRDRGAYPKNRAYLTMRNRLQVIFVHYRGRSIALLAPALLLFELASLALALRRGWLAQWLAAWAWQARNIRSLARRRRTMRRRRVVADGMLLVGGAPPLAPGLIGPGAGARAVAVLSWVLDRYWRLVRRPLGWRPSTERPVLAAPAAGDGGAAPARAGAAFPSGSE